jgi:hypothetical protein
VWLLISKTNLLLTLTKALAPLISGEVTLADTLTFHSFLIGLAS